MCVPRSNQAAAGQGSVAAASQISVALKYLGFNYKNFHPIKLRHVVNQNRSATANMSSAHYSRCQEDTLSPQKLSAVLYSG